IFAPVPGGQLVAVSRLVTGAYLVECAGVAVALCSRVVRCAELLGSHFPPAAADGAARGAHRDASISAAIRARAAAICASISERCLRRFSRRLRALAQPRQ